MNSAISQPTLRNALTASPGVYATATCKGGTPCRTARQEHLELPDNWFELTKDEQERWHGGLAEGFEDELEGDLDEIGPVLPLAHIDLRCACGDTKCQARMAFEREGSDLRLSIEDYEDHFVLAATFLAVLAEDL